MEKIPTASDFLWDTVLTMGDTEPYGHVPPHKINEAMIRFAKLHVEAALKAAAEEGMVSDGGFPCQVAHYHVDKESILAAYPLDNIK